MKTNYDLLDWLGEQAAMEIGREVVLYEKKPSKNVGGVEYVWNEKRGLYGRWARNKYGGAFFTPLEETGEEAAQNIGNEVEKRRRGSPGQNYQKIIPPFERIEPSNCQKYADKMKTEGERLEGIFGAPLNSFVLPDGIYGESKVFPYEDTADKTYPMPSYSKEYAGATVDKYGVHPITGERILVQRRVYDTYGCALQDFDYCHSKFRLHFFPHIHIWINRKSRSYAIEYR